MMDKNTEAFEAWWRQKEQDELRKSFSQGWAHYIWQKSRKEIEVELKQFDEFQICHYGASEDYAKGYIDAQNNANKALTSLGIRVKGNEE